jgi:hypothetical protein
MMTLRSSLLLAATALAAAVFAGAAAADGLPGSPADAPPPSSIEPAATLVLPRAPRPGATATIVLRLDRAATSGLTADRTICAFRLGAAPLPGAAHVSAAGVVCTVRVPRSAAGKTIRGALRVTLTHFAVERQFAFKVARR